MMQSHVFKMFPAHARDYRGQTGKLGRGPQLIYYSLAKRIWAGRLWAAEIWEDLNILVILNLCSLQGPSSKQGFIIGVVFGMILYAKNTMADMRNFNQYKRFSEIQSIYR